MTSLQTCCLIAFGANLGDPLKTLENATGLLGDYGFSVTAISRTIPTAAVGGPPDQPDYVNAAIRGMTAMSALQMVEALLETEIKLGRHRGERWAARSIDLDLLLFGNEILNLPQLRLPHPRMTWRRFVLQPAAEIAGEMVHPVTGLSIGELLTRLELLPRRITWLMPDDPDWVREIMTGDLSREVRMIMPSHWKLLLTDSTPTTARHAPQWSICLSFSADEACAIALQSRLLVWNSAEWPESSREVKWVKDFPGAVLDIRPPAQSMEAEIRTAIQSMD